MASHESVGVVLRWNWVSLTCQSLRTIENSVDRSGFTAGRGLFGHKRAELLLVFDEISNIMLPRAPQHGTSHSVPASADFPLVAGH
jgi:hypothetical protein